LVAAEVVSFLIAVALPAAAATITAIPGGVRIAAGPLVRTIRGPRTTAFTISGKTLAVAAKADVALTISERDSKPPALARDAIPPLEWTKGRMPSVEPRPDVSWRKARSPELVLMRRTITRPGHGSMRAVLEYRAEEFPVTVNLEVYGDHPVIRKWMEIKNSGKLWIKIDRLKLEDLRIDPGFGKPLSLTPAERGAGSSIVAFTNPGHTQGAIAGSEIPSALRHIGDDASMGYSEEHFEWVLGPGESFVSEPVFYYAFVGASIKTVSAIWTPLDRTIEGSFQRFLVERVGIAGNPDQLPTPQWVTWTNFLTKIDDAIVREQAAIAAKAGFSMITLDQGWQEGLLGADPDPLKFPDFAGTAKYVQSLGLRLGAWVSSLRQPGSRDAKLYPNGASVPIRFRNPEGGVAMSFAGPWRHHFAQELVETAKQYNITYFKQDFTNIQFGNIGEESEGRTLKDSVLRGLRNLLVAQDYIREHTPDVTTQITHEIYWGTPGVPCDLAALKHAHLYHIPPNDYSGSGLRGSRFSKDWKMDPAKMSRELITGCWNARQRFYDHRGLPLYGIEYYAAAAMNIGGSLTPEVQDRQVCSWLMGAPLVFAGDLTSLTGENIAQYRSRFDLLKRLQVRYGIYRYFQFSGVPSPTEVEWHWWGKLNHRREGIVVVIRGNGGPDERQINVPWVRPGAFYHLRTLFTGRDLGRFRGSKLQQGALKLVLPKLGQEILEISTVSP
jgi:hypothetical protein